MANAPDNSINNSIANFIEAMSLDTEGTLKGIYLQLQNITGPDGIIISQSSLKDLAEAERKSDLNNRTRSIAQDRNRSDSPYASNRNLSGRGESSSSSYTADSYSSGGKRKTGKKIIDEGLDAFEDEFKKAIFGSADPIKDILSESMTELADQLGVSVGELGKKVGGDLGKIVSDSFVKSDLGGRLTKEWRSMGNAFGTLSKDAMKGLGNILKDPKSFNFSDVIKQGSQSVKSTFRDSFGTMQENLDDINETFFKGKRNRRSSREDDDENIIDSVGEVIDDSFTDLGKAASEGSDALGKLVPALKDSEGAAGLLGSNASELAVVLQNGSAAISPAMGELATVSLPALGAALPLVTIALTVGAELLSEAIKHMVKKVKEAFQPLAEGWKSLSDALKEARNRYLSTNRKNVDLWNKRLQQDVESVTTITFDVIKQSAEKVMEVWDQVETTISATQGYDKAGVQALWSSYARLLKENNLDSYVSSADIMANLEKVLNSGLNGELAEQFSYIATVLNKAIPTQDFFQYASAYASLAANAIKNGKTQEEAIELANAELETFASNLLYASREIAGGFASNMQNGSKLFEQAAQIAIASQGGQGGAGTVSAISGVLTSVSAIVSATAPDLADGIVSAVVDAAVGGNSDTITALRSMAGVGASNTAFLKALAQDPQEVFSTLFENLSVLQARNSANYMEVADALSQVFGMSREAFARVDFAYLADAIRAMNVTTDALQQNMDLLKAGETTSTAEQLRMQKINQYMIEEGLAYVLDSEVGRAVQQHMWEEQMNRELMENEYAVNLTGSARDFLEGISETVTNIMRILNPAGALIDAIGNVALTYVEAKAQREDIKEMIQTGVVGNGNSAAFKLLMPDNEKEISNLGLLDLDYYGWLTGQKSKTSSAKSALNTWGKLITQGSGTIGGMLKGVSDITQSAVGKSALGLLGNTAELSEKNSYYTTSLVQARNSANSLATSADEMTADVKYLMGATGQFSRDSASVVESMMTSMDTFVSTASTLIKEESHGREVTKAEYKALINQSATSTGSSGSNSGSSSSYSSTKTTDSNRLSDQPFYNDFIQIVGSPFATYKNSQYAKDLLQLVAYTKDSYHLTVKEEKQVKDAIKWLHTAEIDTSKSALADWAKTADINSLLQGSGSGLNSNYSPSSSAAYSVSTAGTGNLSQMSFIVSRNAANASGKRNASVTALNEVVENLYDDVATVKSQSTNMVMNKIESSAKEEMVHLAGYMDVIESDLFTEALSSLNAAYEKAVSKGKTKKADKLAEQIEADTEKYAEQSQYAILRTITAANGKTFMSQEDILEQVRNSEESLSSVGATFEKWVEQVYGSAGAAYGMSGMDYLKEALENYGSNINLVRAKFEEFQAQESQRQSKARELHEVQFWEDMQRFATDYFPEYLNEWKRYFVLHEAYTNQIEQAYQDALEMSHEENAKEENAILKLANSLTSNEIWGNFAQTIADPTVQTNMLLSQILLYVQAIMQQNNEVSIVSVPTALTSLGLGITTPIGNVGGQSTPSLV